MESRIVGQIKPVDHDPDFFESNPYPIPYFDNKELKVGFVEAKHEPYLLDADKVLWDENGDFYLCVSCGCDWEKEHGLQLVFKEGKKLTRASGHDGGF